MLPRGREVEHITYLEIHDAWRAGGFERGKEGRDGWFGSRWKSGSGWEIRMGMEDGGWDAGGQGGLFLFLIVGLVFVDVTNASLFFLSLQPGRDRGCIIRAC